MTKEEIEKNIASIELAMSGADFWTDKNKAQEMIRKLEDLRSEREGLGKYDKGDAVFSIFTGAGGDDAEDFSRMLFEMYARYVESKGWQWKVVDENKTDQGGYRSITLEISGKRTYGTLKNESGVHRLVRMSPFNAKGKRNTSFSMVEVLPKFENVNDFKIPETELEISFARSGGKGGQNVNKRETAVRIVHIPTKISVHTTGERSQEANKEEAFRLIHAKVWKHEEEVKKARERGMAISTTTDNEWGSQIRSYVLHPYKMVKDHRTGVETGNVDKVLYDGDLDEFIEAEKEL
jgi:peptide chain release factor 2